MIAPAALDLVALGTVETVDAGSALQADQIYQSDYQIRSNRSDQISPSANQIRSDLPHDISDISDIPD